MRMFHGLRVEPKSFIMICLLTVMVMGASAPTKARTSTDGDDSYATRADAMQLADDIAQNPELDRDWVHAIIGQARQLSQVPRLMLPPTSAGAKNWRAYRSRFIDSARIRAGVRFWQRNRALLTRAEAEYGVPAEIIVGIIGVETVYGQNTGRYRVLDALTTLSLDFPATHPRAEAREAFFRSELEQFLRLCRQTGMSPLEPRGSYAGAMGLPQFMPSSWLRWAVDFDDDGRIDLWASDADAIGSVANYFVAHGWIPGQPTHYAVRLDADADLEALLEPDILPSFEPERFTTLGARLGTDGQTHEGPLALIELPNGDPKAGGSEAEYVAGTNNFYVITRYNQSSFYAMSVIELGREVAAAMSL